MNTIKLMLAFGLVLLLQGCLYVSVKKKVISDESKRVSIKFESSEAAAVFNSKTAQKIFTPDDPCVGKSTLGIPFIMFIDHTNYYETVCFNRKARLGDLNNDGVITLEEAKNLQ